MNRFCEPTLYKDTCKNPAFVAGFCHCGWLIGPVMSEVHDLNDVPYTWGYYGEMNPLLLNYVCALGRFVPPRLDDEFTVCELGCGHGVSANIHALLHPQGQFTGIDIAEGHIVNARELATEAGLSNAHFERFDITTMDQDALAPMDYIALHGVYSWVDAETRYAICRLIKDKLKPGGMVYLSYNAMPGWSALLPLRQLMHAHAADIDDNPVEKARRSLAHLQSLKQQKVGFFEDNPLARSFVDEMSEQAIEYVAHEFFGADATPFYFTDVESDMAAIGLRIVGSADVHLNFIDLAAPQEFHEMLRAATSRREFESTGDFIRNQRFRRDLYIKDPAILSEEEQQAYLSAIPFGTSCVASDFHRTARFNEVELAYREDVFEALIRRLCNSADTIAELKDEQAFAPYNPAILIDAVKFLTANRQLLPFARPTHAANDSALAATRFELSAPLNLAMFKRGLFNWPNVPLASPNAGIGFEVSTSDALFTVCTAEAPADMVTEWASQRIAESDWELGEDGGNVGATLSAAFAAFRKNRLPKLIELGILEPVTN